MAESSEDGQEKTEEPTPKRQQDAKEKGQVPRSKELNTTMVMVLGAGGLLVFGNYMVGQINELFHVTFGMDRQDAFDPDAPFHMLHEAFWIGIKAVAPFALVMLVAALLTPALMGGWTFTASGMAPKLEKMSPLKGLKRMFGVNALVELGKSIAKVLVVFGVAMLLFWAMQDRIAAMTRESLQQGLMHGATLFFWAFFALAAALIIVAAVDIPYQIWDHTQKLKMTHQEVKDENKETQGKPEVKSKIRQLQNQIAQGRMMENVPKADVVVTNPTRYAIALRYDQSRMRAPQVVAKGTDVLAARIREIADDNGIPLFEAPPLARALYHTTELEQEIPAGLYLSVAQVLAYIYQLQAARRTGGQQPERPRPTVPEEFKEYARPPEADDNPTNGRPATEF
ncbi:flagellar biosynthesis protein FlhB [Aquisalimonas lutea]|uniref:flagellar biosynthesis protein FlhB n=1 Tax=Aquisalimonas lutea TaxID=1327750 RepID=UPI0025B4AD1D|nr:flagellar biosynthesis protein FlhB [Aquisalimonas lutea]MDN3518293.1 flagellar biosynthesis protein FlhB [Aquisalimonas lutea]